MAMSALGFGRGDSIGDAAGHARAVLLQAATSYPTGKAL